MNRAVLVLALVGCHRRAPMTSCADDITGVYVVDGRRWDVIAGAPETFEAYPLFDDAPAIAGLEVAPRVIDLKRTPRSLEGVARRRYMRGADTCTAHVPVHVTACHDDTLELVVTDPVPPVSFGERCTWPHPDASHVERWRRER